MSGNKPHRFQRIHDFLGAKAIMPSQGEAWEVAKEGVTRVS